jgi:decaprenylphospho-beta-D-erythro-pentofuranosid-2-ulose 2-reductase
MTAAAPAASAGATRRVLLLGGSSEIGLAIVRRLGREQPVSAYLVGRDDRRLQTAAAGLTAAGIPVSGSAVLDASDTVSHPAAIAAAFEAAGGFDTVVLAVGVLGAQAGLDAGADDAVEVMDVNFTGAGSLLIASLRQLRAAGRGEVIVLSSVAGERVRASNAVYGAAKAGLDALAQGLADQLLAERSQVRVLVVRPGFVTTRMTAGLKRAPMASSADAVAAAAVAGLASGGRTIWVPRRLRAVFFVLRHLPSAVFRRLPL